MLFLTSCCSICPPQIEERIIEVKVPVPVPCPIPPQIEPVHDPVVDFKKGQTLEQLVKDLRASRVIWRERANSLEILINSYRTHNGTSN